MYKDNRKQYSDSILAKSESHLNEFLSDFDRQRELEKAQKKAAKSKFKKLRVLLGNIFSFLN